MLLMMVCGRRRHVKTTLTKSDISATMYEYSTCLLFVYDEHTVVQYKVSY